MGQTSIVQETTDILAFISHAWSPLARIAEIAEGTIAPSYGALRHSKVVSDQSTLTRTKPLSSWPRKTPRASPLPAVVPARKAPLNFVFRLVPGSWKLPLKV